MFSNVPTPAPRKRRDTGGTISVRLVAPGTLAPNDSHPLAHLPREQRVAAASMALGQLVLTLARPPPSSAAVPSSATSSSVRPEKE